jgi:hypothetical protein
MKTTLLFFFISLLLYSCKKNTAATQEVLSTYSSEYNFIVERAVMYTRSGADSSIPTIQSYLQRHSINSTFFNDPLVNNAAPAVTIEFIPAQRALVTLTNDPFGTKHILAAVTENSDARILLQSADTSFIVKFVNECGMLEDLVIKKYAFEQCDANPQNQNVSCKVVQQFTLLKINGQYRLSYVNYLTSNVTSPASYCFSALKNVIGLVNSTALAPLGVADTVIIQKMQLPLKLRR